MNGRVIYKPRPDTTPEAERAVLADALRFLLESTTERGRLPDESGPNDPDRSFDDRAKEIIR